MIDLRREVFEALNGILPGRAFFVAPPADAVEPCLSFLELDNAETIFADDEVAMSEITYAVDVWAAAPGDIPPLAQAADKAMKDLGFIRTHASDLPPDEVHIYHKNMQYAVSA